ncbi:MAG TPA: YpdA family putative bacillithiol disulfide reductase [Edaphocola sp.]|nr:YpdA family putative bacillithiol disulfide reductase [Edaphocola sp.]
MEKELIIIGAGPIGLACAIAAQEAGLDYLILEKGTLVNSLFNYPLLMTFFSTAEKLEIGGVPFTCIRPKPGRPEALEYYRKVAADKHLSLKLFTMVERLEKLADGRFFIQSANGGYYARHVVVATGFYDIAYPLNIPGEHLPKVRHYYKEPHGFAFQKIVVVGAQNSAVDAALETYRKGAEVTMVVRGRQIGQRVKYWVRPDIINRIEEGSITAYFGSSLLEIREKSVLIRSDDGIDEIDNDFVLAMTGYRPDKKLLESVGVAFSDDGKERPFYDPASMETNIPGLFLAGVICGGVETHKWFIENSRAHAGLIIDTIVKRK